jgi:hypothetical protein
MNTQRTRHERSDLSLGFGKNEPANTAMKAPRVAEVRLHLMMSRSTRRRSSTKGSFDGARVPAREIETVADLVVLSALQFICSA